MASYFLRLQATKNLNEVVIKYLGGDLIFFVTKIKEVLTPQNMHTGRIFY